MILNRYKNIKVSVAAFFMIFPFIKKGGDIGTVSQEMFVETSFILMGFALFFLILKYDKIEKFVITFCFYPIGLFGPFYSIGLSSFKNVRFRRDFKEDKRLRKQELYHFE